MLAFIWTVSLTFASQSYPYPQGLPPCEWQEMTLYLVWDSAGVSERTDVVIEDLFQAVDQDTDDEGNGRRRKGKKRRNHSSGSSSEKAEKDGDSSDSGSEVGWDRATIEHIYS